MANTRIIDTNKKAYHDYFIQDCYEAGIVLVGSEVKSVRQGHVNLRDAFCIVEGNAVWLIGAHIRPYDKGSYFNPDAKRKRKLLLHKEEVNKLRGKIDQKGFTLVPTKIYFSGGLVKVEVALAKGKELHDKRASIADREVKRRLDREIKQYNAR